ncbi:telomere capping, CST complex subunit-domain-containing protein, partial [Schizothecium vesticola]
PSQLCLLSSLPFKEAGDKVRFLGCVSSYSISSATLTLIHPRPDDRSPVRALVNVDLVLARLGSEQTRVGEWVNVLGYITSVPSIGSKPADGPRTPTVSVQALLLWSAGSVDLQKYEASAQSLAAGNDGANSGNLLSGSLSRNGGSRPGQ